MGRGMPGLRPGEIGLGGSRVFARNRDNQVETRGQLLRGELVETFDHALRAAGYAASGLRDSVAGRSAGKVRDATVRGWDSATTAFAPLSEAAQTRVKDIKVRRKGPEMKRRWPMLAGLLAGGAAVGATVAVVMRRRRQQWEGYEPDEELDLSTEPRAVDEELAPEAAPPPGAVPDNQVRDAARAASGGE